MLLTDTTIDDYESMRHCWMPDLICTECGYETDFEIWYSKHKLNEPEICPECFEELERI